MEIKAQNVNQALSAGIHWLRTDGLKEDSRNGTVLVSSEPVITTYRFPMERVLFSSLRDANPFFHMMEALWMLAGRNDLAWPLFFNSKFGGFSDDGKTVHGAYGHRWRKAFYTGYDQFAPENLQPADQLKLIAKELRNRPDSRRMVLQMWSISSDFHLASGDAMGKDVPCNTHAYFLVKDNLLEMTVCCRSNDIIWGAYGANAVHFSILAEYMAASVGVGIGPYHQFSNNYHLYPALYQKLGQSVDEALFELAGDAEETDHYSRLNSGVTASPIINTPVDEWDAELQKFFADPMGRFTAYNDPFFEQCALPMYQAWFVRKNKLGSGLAELKPMRDLYPDWYRACGEWIQRREARKGAKSCNDCGKLLCTCHRVL